MSAPVTNPPVTPKALSAGQKRTHPAHIPCHFPEFPDPHTYIKTPVSQASWRYAVVTVWDRFGSVRGTRLRLSFCQEGNMNKP